MDLHLSIIRFYHFVTVKLQTHFKPMNKKVLYIIYLKGGKLIQNTKTVKYSVLFDHSFYDKNYLKVRNFVDMNIVLCFLIFFARLYDFYSKMTEM